jgi:demethylmenaquinone methyltransferase/2-methoxy-6-polyprenyl-1,4-benzoquinol methylase
MATTDASTYDALSRWYDLLANASEGPHRRLGLRMLDVQPGETALELGYGTGHALVELSRTVGPKGRVVGVDLSQGMAQEASMRLRRADLVAPVTTVIGDAARPPLRSNCVDVVFMSFTLELFPDETMDLVLRQCRRVLRPEGRLGVVSLAKSEDPDLPERLYTWVHRRMPKWVDCRPILLACRLEDAGFRVEQVAERKMWGLPVTVAVAREIGR